MELDGGVGFGGGVEGGVGVAGGVGVCGGILFFFFLRQKIKYRTSPIRTTPPAT